MRNIHAKSVVILDLSAVFNTIDHELLLQVLHNRFGISGSALKWYATYLRPRRFRIYINENCSAHLKLNESKTEFIYFGSRQQLRKCQHKTVNINGENINRSTRVKYPGGHLDEELKFNQYVQAKCKAAVINLCKIQNIRRHLTKDTCHQLVLLLAISHLNYGNAILSGSPEVTIKLHQKVQNMAARIILNKHPRDSAT